MTRIELNAALLKAHAERNTSNENNTELLAELYYKAYELTMKEDLEAGYFFLSNAYVYALESDHSNANHIESILTETGRL